MSAGLKLLLDLGPLVVFFGAYFAGQIYIATGAFMVATVAAISVYWIKTRHIPANQLITLAIVLIFGGLTLWLHDDRFIKMKPTMIYALFAAILFGGLLTGRPFLKLVFEAAFPPMVDRGWRLLTIRWACLFAALAVLNEIVWRNFSEEFWVSFKLFGFLPLTMVFAMAQIPLMNRYAIQEKPADEA
ncbi:septation protein A [Iodidimonas sp. SYSU 1G8]|uniref:septation protein A n=1 Tax=Iodidimonas sp. SYSU 1G8 TaxID=3133967 RepID=UPI0031FE5887